VLALELAVKLSPIGLDVTPMALLRVGGSNSAVSSALSVISAGNGRFNLAVASRFNVNRTVDGATPPRRAISLNPTPAVLKRSTSRTWRIVVLSAGIGSPVQKPKERTLIGPAEAPLNRATSSRIPGRLPPGIRNLLVQHRIADPHSQVIESAEPGKEPLHHRLVGYIDAFAACSIAEAGERAAYFPGRARRDGDPRRGFGAALWYGVAHCREKAL
jgi:hypothetical protein